MKAICFLALVSITAKCFSQPVIREIRSGEFTFPIIELADKEVTEKINDYLQTNLLDQTVLKNAGAKVFEKVKYTYSHPGINSIDYEIRLKTKKLLSLVFYEEATGAYTQGFKRSFLFNVQNGEIILTEDIFLKESLPQIETDLKQKRNKLINEHLDTLRNDKIDANDLSMVENSFESCNQYADINNFIADRAGITFTKEECVPHAILVYGTDLDINYSLEELGEKFSDFGRKIFTDSVGDIKNEFQPSLKKPLIGTIDKFPVVMQLKIEDDNSVDGFYYYTSQGICLEVSGNISGNKISLIEEDKSGKVTGRFEGIISGTLIKGKWINKKTGKSSSFIVQSNSNNNVISYNNYHTTQPYLGR